MKSWSCSTWICATHYFFQNRFKMISFSQLLWQWSWYIYNSACHFVHRILRFVSPWYNRTSWLGVKHQLTYLHFVGWHQFTSVGAVAGIGESVLTDDFSLKCWWCCRNQELLSRQVILVCKCWWCYRNQDLCPDRRCKFCKCWWCCRNREPLSWHDVNFASVGGVAGIRTFCPYRWC